MFPSKTISLLLAGHLMLVSPQETDTSDISTSTESQPVTEPVGLEYFLGENGNKLIFDEDSPIQYAINFDYGPIINSITTILEFLFSTSSPGYVLATYDYGSLLSRLTPSPVRDMALNYTSGYTQKVIIVLSSLLSGFAIFQVLRHGLNLVQSQLQVQDVTEERSGARSLKHLERQAENVLTAGDSVNKVQENESFDNVINWLNKIVVLSNGPYDSSF